MILFGTEIGTVDILVANGINGAENHRARQVKINDFDEFDYIFAMDVCINLTHPRSSGEGGC
jgi:protein-tyrosine-phosphatase